MTRRTFTCYITTCSSIALALFLAACQTVQDTAQWYIRPGDIRGASLRPDETHTYALTLDRGGIVKIELLADFKSHKTPGRVMDDIMSPTPLSPLGHGPRIHSAQSTLHPQLIVKLKDGATVAGYGESGYGRNSSISQLLPRGEYYLTAKGYGGSSGHYKLSVNYAVPNRTLAIGKSTEGTLGANELHCYELNVAKKGTLVIDMIAVQEFPVGRSKIGSSLPRGHLLYPSMVLHSSNAEVLQRHTDIQTNYHVRITKYVFPGDYYLVTGGRYSSGAYRLNAIIQEDVR